MDFNNFLKLTLGGIILLVVGGGLGYYYAPDKIKVEERIVEKVIIQKDTKDTKKYDPITGKLIEETHEVKDKQTNVDTKEKVTEKTKTQKTYAVKVGVFKVVNNSDSPKPRVGVEIRLPFFNTWLGAEGDISSKDPTVGVYGRMEF